MIRMNKKVKSLWLGIFALVILALSAIFLLHHAQTKPIAITEWPENAYTVQLPRPDFGQPSRLINTRDGCGVLLDGCGEEDLTSYVSILRSNGYSVLDTEESEDSKVMLLDDGVTRIQLSLSGETLLIGIRRS